MATTIHPPTAVFREEQNFGWWVYATLALMAAIGIAATLWVRPDDPAIDPRGLTGPVPVALVIGLVLPLLLVVGVLRMTTEVTPLELRVWFGWIPTYRRTVPIGSVRSLEVVQYRPLRDYGGWGVRMGRNGERALNARGNMGVRLVLDDGSRLLIGSQQPEALARALELARRTAV